MGCHFDTILLSAPCQRLLKCSPPPAKTSPSALREDRIPPEVSPSLLWQSPWDHFAASEATLASPAPPFGAKIPPKVTSKWLSKATLTSLFNDFGDASFWIQNGRYLLNQNLPGRGLREQKGLLIRRVGKRRSVCIALSAARTLRHRNLRWYSIVLSTLLAQRSTRRNNGLVEVKLNEY